MLRAYERPRHLREAHWLPEGLIVGEQVGGTSFVGPMSLVAGAKA